MEARDTPDTVQIKGASHMTQAFVFGRSSRGYTFEACVFEVYRVGVDEVVEVDVLGCRGK